MKHRIIASVVVLGLMTLRSSAQRPASFDDSLVVAPHYVEYLSDPTERFVRQAAELKRRIGSAPHVILGFATGITSSPIRCMALPQPQVVLSGSWHTSRRGR